MKVLSLAQVLVLSVVAFLAGMSSHQWLVPARVAAQSQAYNFYVEPGSVAIQPPDKSGQFYGKLMVDIETGNIWGFPTIVASPYPMDAVHTAPPTSHPVYLGRYDLAATRK